MDTGLAGKQYSAEEEKLIKLYGKLPAKKNLLGNKLKDRKFFDSGDYALSRAGKDEPGIQVGQQHPTPENIPHNLTTHPGGATTTPGTGSIGSNAGQIGPLSGSPVKEPSLLHQSNVLPSQSQAASQMEEQARQGRM